METLTQTDTKHCRKCDTEKIAAEFNRNSRSSDGLQSWCRLCHKTAKTKNPSRKDPESRARWQRKHDLNKRFGLSPDDYDGLLASQNGVCAICERPERLIRSGKLMRLAVDHDHVTGEIRGLLCAHCNRALGLLDDRPDLFDRAKNYLAREI